MAMNKAWMIGLWLLLLPLTGAAQLSVPRPVIGSYIHDFAAVVTPERQVEIQNKGRRLKESFKTEIAVVTIGSLEGEDAFDYSLKLARAWGIGSKDSDVRGILILVAVKDRKTSFRTSRHIEGELPDGVTGEISRQMDEYFKRGDFGGGLSAGLDRILERLQVAPASAPQPNSPGRGPGLGWLLIIGGPLAAAGIGFALWAIRRKRRKAEREQRERAAGENRAKYFSADAGLAAPDHPTPPRKRQPDKRRRDKRRNAAANSPAPGYDPSASAGYAASSAAASETWSSNDTGSSSSSDSGASYDSGASSDSGASYSGGSDFGGGGSDSNW